MLPQANAYAMIRRLAAAAGIATKLGNHSFRATEFTAYLKKRRHAGKAAAIPNHTSTRTTRLYDRRRDEVSLDEVERIVANPLSAQVVMDAIVVIAGSAGGFEALRRFVAALPTRCTVSFFIVIHISSYPSVLPSLLAPTAGLHSAFAYNGAPIEAGRIYVASPDHHMLLEPSRVRLN